MALEEPQAAKAPKPPKSVLKTPRKETTLERPLVASTTSKKVRIRSVDNIVHFFHRSPASACSSLETFMDDDDSTAGAARTLNFEEQPDASATSSYRHGTGSSYSKPINAFAATAAWMVVSSLLIFVNKAIMVDWGWSFPFALTAIGQFVSAAVGEQCVSVYLAFLTNVGYPHFLSWLCFLPIIRAGTSTAGLGPGTAS